MTEPSPDIPKGPPVPRLTDACAGDKEDTGKILPGAFEPKAKPGGADAIPLEFIHAVR